MLHHGIMTRVCANIIYVCAMKTVLVSLYILLVGAGPLWAAPLRYSLDMEQSHVGFSVPFGPDQINGTMPVIAADIVIDFERATNSDVSVSLDVGNARASFPFATQALKGPKVLAARDFPTISFVSRSVRPTDSARAKAVISGDITIRGVTRPINLDAEVFRQPGVGADDLSRLSIELKGSVSRSAFGATGWADLVGDTVTLDILVRINKVP